MHRHAAAEAAEATAPEATEAATAAPRRIAHTPSRAFPARPPLPIYSRMLARPRTLPSGFIAPCLPTKTDELPSGGACRPVEGRPPMIITESRSLAGVLRDLASEYLTPIASTNGQAGGFSSTLHIILT